MELLARTNPYVRLQTASNQAIAALIHHIRRKRALGMAVPGSQTCGRRNNRIMLSTENMTDQVTPRPTPTDQWRQKVPAARRVPDQFDGLPAAVCKPALLAVALALVVSTLGCTMAASSASHGVDYAPAFDASYGNLGIEPGFLTGSPTE
jgi:hypothetical protein